MDRVTNISWRTTSGAALGGFAYEYDAVGRITSRSHVLGDPSQPSPMSQSFQKAYAYDNFDRLASDGDVTYTYDAAGNRLTRSENGETVTYTLCVGDRLASWTGGAYNHDAAGNVTRIERDGRPTLDLAWNSQYQLVSVSTNGVFAEDLAGTPRKPCKLRLFALRRGAGADQLGSVPWGYGGTLGLYLTVGGAYGKIYAT